MFLTRGRTKRSTNGKKLVERQKGIQGREALEERHFASALLFTLLVLVCIVEKCNSILLLNQFFSCRLIPTDE